VAREEVIEIIKRYAAALKEKGINFRKIILFGSHAAGSQRRDSDIDILANLAPRDQIKRN